MIDLEFIADVERRMFRTEHDTGANINALMIWNMVREHAGLPKLQVLDLTIGEEYCDKTYDAVSEREYPLRPRTEKQMARIKAERQREGSYPRYFPSGNDQVAHLYNKGSKVGDHSVCGAFTLDSEGLARPVLRYTYICTECQFTARKLTDDD